MEDISFDRQLLLRRQDAVLKRIFIGIIAVVAICLSGLAVLIWRPAIPPVAPQSLLSFAPELVARGEVLAGAGYCAICHTVKGGKPFAGGYAMKTDFGTIYSTNITPDAKTGIGAWSEEAFRRAMHEGVAQDGSHLYPVFPFDHFTKIFDVDVSALYAYFMTREPVDAPAQANALPFPLNIRALQAVWKSLFFRSGRFEYQSTHNPKWNRGAYLAEGVAHCGACHTPRNPLGAEERGQAYSGGKVDGQLAPALTKANFSPVPWNQDELFAYLRNGNSQFHSRAGVPMAFVIGDGLAKLPDTDIQSLAVYFADIGGTTSWVGETGAAIKRAQGDDPADQGPHDDDSKKFYAAIKRVLVSDHLDLDQHHDASARLYMAACASCHFNNALLPNKHRPNLSLISATNSPDPTSLINVILFGHKAGMPAFGQGFNDADIARIAAYLRATRTASAPWADLEQKVAAMRAAHRKSDGRSPERCNHDQIHDQRTRRERGCRGGDAAALGNTRRHWVDGHQVRVRHRPVWGLHGACRRPCDPLVHHPRQSRG